MRGVVYVDVLFFTNALIGWCLLRCSASLTGSAFRPLYLFGGGVLAGLSSLMMLLPPLPGWSMWMLKGLSAVLIVAVAFPKSSWRTMGKNLLWYLALNLLLSGVVLFALYYLEPKGIQLYNMTLYFNVSPLLLIGSVTATYLLLQALTFFFGRPKEQVILPFRTLVNRQKIEGKALWDTGYQIRDPISGANTFLLSFPQIRAQLPKALEMAISDYFCTGMLHEGAGIRLVPARTATGLRVLPAVKAPLTLWMRERWCETTAILAVFTPEALGENGAFTALVNPASAEL